MQSCEYYSAVEAAAKFYCTLFFDGSLIRDPEVNKKSHRKTKINVSGKGFTTLECWIKASRMRHWLKYGRSWNCQSHAWFVWGSWCEIFSHTEFIKVATSYFQFHSLMLCSVQFSMSVPCLNWNSFCTNTIKIGLYILLIPLVKTGYSRNDLNSSAEKGGR